jgi:hypothetical protein
MKVPPLGPDAKKPTLPISILTDVRLVWHVTCNTQLKGLPNEPSHSPQR